MNPDIVHFWYNGDSTLTAFPQALKLDVAPAYFLFGVDPGIYQERQLKSNKPVTLELCAGVLGLVALPGSAGLFQELLCFGSSQRTAIISFAALLRLFLYVRQSSGRGGIHR